MSRRIGGEAEAAAARYLVRQGFSILARNYTVRGAEVDIIAREGDYLAFVEVKYRKDAAAIAPREAVTPAKQRRLCMAALRWMQENGMGDAPARFDVVEVTSSGITLLRGAFSYIE